MMKRFAAAALIVACALAIQVIPASCIAADALVGLYGDAGRMQIDVWANGFTLIEVWAWIYVDDGEISGFEFKLSYPDNVIRSTTVMNPLVIPDEEPDDPAVGVRARFSGCQTGWIWVLRQYCFLVSGQPGKIRFIGYPESEAFLTHDCDAESTPRLPRIVNSIYTNQWHLVCGPDPPYFMHLAVESPAGVRARLTEPCPTLGPERFLLISETNPPDTMHAVQAVKRDSITYGLTFESPMIDHVTYRLRTLLCNTFCLCFEEVWRFTYEGPIATLLRGHDVSVVDGAVELAWELSDVDRGATFAVLRSADGGAFEALGGEPNEIARLSYRYVDAGVEPGRRYVYRVEYSAGGERMELFTSEEIALPAARLALHQNVPNPFNPSTTISFTLPEPRTVTLEIYDVSGRLVARLLDGGPLPAGTHYVDWNGRDGGGKSCASGIYFCRLATGKDRLTRKMALLR